MEENVIAGTKASSYNEKKSEKEVDRFNKKRVRFEDRLRASTERSRGGGMTEGMFFWLGLL